MYYVSTNALVSYILDNEAVKLMNLILVSIMKHKDVESGLDFSLFLQDGNMSPSRIKEIRKRFGMTQVVFADLLGVVHITYCTWERGVKKPSSPACALLQIAEKHPEVFLVKRREIIKGVMKFFGKKGQ